jgi:hypothetical protein
MTASSDHVTGTIRRSPSMARVHAPSGMFTLAISEANEILGEPTEADAARLPAAITAFSWHDRLQQATSRDGSVAPYKRGTGASDPSAPTGFLS